MEELRNLKQIYSLAAGRFNQYEGKDFVLPRIFKEQVKEINSNTITYNDYSAVIETKGNQNGVLNIYLPNQWFYIASYFTDFYNELQRYKKEALKVVSKERLKDLNGSSLTEQEESRLQRLSLTEQSKLYLRRFMTDYSWWFGAKTIDRGDFYVSPILNSARLVNASQSFVADLCAFLANKTDLVQAIISGEEAASKKNNSSESFSFQQIFYGAPGTGKSHWIKKRLKELEVSKENIFRTTFHPDSDYSTFVGAYKPTMKKQYRYDGKVKAKYYEDDDLADAKKDDVIIDKVIQYDFIPQTFVKAYVRAYKTTDNVYLVIEEINRGNCAQIFGDLFQLLDRDENGISEYTIKADTDLRTYLEDALGKDADGIKDGELCLPSNLYIWATMNTSDQSLFPIDSAFKRRWDWKYEPIKYENTNWKIEIGGTKYLWTDFQRKVNSRIFDDTSSEDKMLGDYFVNPPTGIISKDLFLNKILFYLWNDVCKDGDGDIFKSDDDKDIKFSDLYGSDGTSKLFSMMRHLKVKPIDGTSDDNDEDDEDDAEGSTSKRYSINGEVTNKDGKKWGKGTLVKRAVEIYCEKHPSETAEQIRDAWMSLGFKIPHLIETKDDKEKRLTDSRDKTGRERAREIILSNGESIYVSTEVGSGAVLDGFGDFLTKIQSKPEWGISIQEL